jgi:hypothetical protein
MKKLLLSLMLVAFAVAVQAGDDKSCADKACCSKTKATADAKAACPMAGKQAKDAAASKQPIQSPKALASK